MRGKGEGSVHFDKNRGLWVGVIELETINGNRQRKTVRRKDKRELLDELAELRVELKRSGHLPTAHMTVEQWFTVWLRLEEREVRPNTLSNYRTVTEKYILPNIGKVKLDKVSGTHLRKVYDAMRAKGRSSTYVLNAHRILSSAFKVAVREGKISVNPTVRVSTPRKATTHLQTLDLTEGLQLLGHLASRPDGARWATALLTGARRGEVIGLERSRIADDELDLSWQLQRIVWKHGCGPSNGVDKNDLKTYPCGTRRDCPQRHIPVPDDYEYRSLTGGLYLTRPKSDAGWRVLPLVEPLRTILDRHMSAAEPNPYDLVFARSGGRPYDPDQDSKDWRLLLKQIGITKDVRLHDIRHTTVELLYAAGVPEHIIMQIVGHSTVVMTRSYRSRTDAVRLRAAMEQFSAQFLTPLELPETPTGAAP
ncbi:MAG: hypothetical protein JWR04_183 [Rhodoglobus sp.]|nr:hypothetical protein [Rhodoglobus sp.]